MSLIIRSRYRGTLDKYIGDAIMAFWGAPMEDARHARNGVLAGLAMLKECTALNARFAARGWPALRIGVGVNSGTVRVGDMGSQLRRAYTAMGDAVNVASRLEGRTKYYGVGFLVGEATRNLVEDVVFREIDLIKVKGKDAALRIFEPLEQALGSEETALWEDAVTAVTGAALRAAHRPQRLPPAGRKAPPPPPRWGGVTAFCDEVGAAGRLPPRPAASAVAPAARPPSWSTATS
jgi:adenylate cyclase